MAKFVERVSLCMWVRKNVGKLPNPTILMKHMFVSVLSHRHLLSLLLLYLPDLHAALPLISSSWLCLDSSMSSSLCLAV